MADHAPHRLMCTHTYGEKGQWALRLDTDREVLYGPYISVLAYGRGPRVSEARTSCKLTAGRRGSASCSKRHKEYRCVNAVRGLTPERDSVTVHHRFIFSALSPGRVNMLDTVAVAPGMKANATEAQRVQMHDQWEQISEFHPRSTDSRWGLWESRARHASLAPIHHRPRRVSQSWLGSL
jgi:hypothetical protein